jgi:hypothetical protein
LELPADGSPLDADGNGWQIGEELYWRQPGDAFEPSDVEGSEDGCGL